MPATNQHVYQLGCDPVVTLTIIEDEGNLVFILNGADETTDIDGFFFNLTDDTITPTMTIFPKVDDPNGDVIDFRAEPGILNQLDNGAQTQEQYDVEVQFGALPGSNAGQVNDTGFTLYLDAGRPLTIDDVDLSKMVAVVDSDGGMGIALAGGTVAAPEVTTVVHNIDFQFDNGTNIHGWADADDGVASSDGWYAANGEAIARGGNDGALRLDPITMTGAAALSFDIRAINAQNFEADGAYADSFTVEVQLDDGNWVVLDEFRVDPATNTFTGTNTGQTFDGGSMTTLTYEGGILDNIDGEVSFRMVADISASNELLAIDNINVSATTDGSAPIEVPVVIASDDFSGISYASQSQIVESSANWAVCNGQLYTDGCYDGQLVFDQMQVDAPVEFSIDARGINLHNFEASGQYEDTIRVEVQIDGGEWVLLDEFRVNADGTALVGSETGQEITSTMSTLDYSGGVLDTADSSVQFRIDADISAWNEAAVFDNAEFRMIETVHSGACEDFDDASAGDVVSDQFDGVTITAQRAGDSVRSENDAMIFDTNNPTGGDTDLAYSGQGNVIIISEDNDGSDPDDNAGGGTINMEFDDISTVSSLTVLDVEEAGGTIDLYDIDGELINSIDIPAAGDNSIQTIEINATGVASMDVNLVGSGAIDDLCHSSEDGGVYCEQYMVAYDDPNNNDAQPYEEATEDDMAMA